MWSKIDYYAFTIPVKGIFGTIGAETQALVIASFVSLLTESAANIVRRTTFDLEAAKGFYHSRLRHEVTGCALSVGSVNAHIYVELSGKACDFLESVDSLAPLIAATAERCSRIDFAVDFQTDTTPEHFSASRNSKRWKYAPTYPSASGTTVYIGSRKGERMARVYRYSKPHPRSALLRVEAEYKGDAAREAARLLQTEPLDQVCAKAHAVFGWTDPLWQEAKMVGGKIPYTAHSPSNANTVRWLYGDVVSALRRATKEGLIDFEEWLKFVREGGF